MDRVGRRSDGRSQTLLRARLWPWSSARGSVASWEEDPASLRAPGRRALPYPALLQHRVHVTMCVTGHKPLAGAVNRGGVALKQRTPSSPPRRERTEARVGEDARDLRPR